MARTLELDTITEPSNSGTANITLSSDTTTTMPLVDINGGAIDGTTVGVASPSSVAATTLTASGATTLNGDVTLGNASADTITVTGTMAGIDNKSGMTGEIRMWGGTSAPTGWLLCDGASVSRSTYAALYAITGDAFGNGDGSSTFNVPDMEGRSPVGVGTGAGGGAEAATGGTVPAGGSALTARSLGEWTGAEVLSTAQLAEHSHTAASTTPGSTGSAGSHSHSSAAHVHTSAAHVHSSAAHSHNVVNTHLYGRTGATGSTVAVGGDATNWGNTTTGTTTPGNTGSTTPGNTGSTTPGSTGTTGSHSHSIAAHTHTIANTGSTSKFTTPIMCVNFIIKT